MAITNLYVSESWQKLHAAFTNINFTAFDYETVKESLINYVKLQHPEAFQDFIESSDFIALLEIFAYVAELMAYRVDAASHENFISTAERKQNILRLAKLVAYRGSRNIPARGLVKIESVMTDEDVFDSLGQNLAGKMIFWADSNNTRWKEQFMLVMSRVMEQGFNSSLKTHRVDDIEFNSYTLKTIPALLRNGVFAYKTSGADTFSMELVPTDIDESGPLERAPNSVSTFGVVYADDGRGDSSPYTGFLAMTKQGVLNKILYSFDSELPNRTVDIGIQNINDTDVWLNQLDEFTQSPSPWTAVDTVKNPGQSVIFNTDTSTRKKFEVETLEGDEIRLIFGDGDFADIPFGSFEIWVRQSAGEDFVIPKARIQGVQSKFSYLNGDGEQSTLTFGFSAVSSLQNASASEAIEHIRQTAPAAYYSQNRMVNGQDYNTFMLKDQSILRLRAFNRTFVGQPKYLDWNEATGKYQNVKLFGDDATIRLSSTVSTQTATVESKLVIDEKFEPYLLLPEVSTALLDVAYMDETVNLRGVAIAPRSKFIEDSSLGILEKTEFQNLLDGHYYGETVETVFLTTAFGSVEHAIVDNDADKRIWDPAIPRAITDPLTASGYSILPPNGLQSTTPALNVSVNYIPYRAAHGSGAATITNFIAGDQPEVFTARYDTDTFIVTSSVEGIVAYVPADGTSHEIAGRAVFTLSITATTPFVTDDTFIFDADAAIVQRNFINVGGKFTFSASSTSNLSLVISASKTSGSSDEWTSVVNGRVIEVISPSTKFWYNDSSSVVDYDTGRRVRDFISILRSNLNGPGNAPLDHNLEFDIIGQGTTSSGDTNINALRVSPRDGTTIKLESPLKPDNAFIFHSLLRNGAFTYKTKVGTSWLTSTGASLYTDGVTLLQDLVYDADGLSPLGDVVRARDTDYVYDVLSGDTFVTISGESFVPSIGKKVKNLAYTAAGVSLAEGVLAAGKYKRSVGRAGMDFMWSHFAPHANLIDPSPTNINDIYVLTRGYYNEMQQWASGKLSVEPSPPTSFELRSAYRSMLQNKVISDTVIMHSGKIRFILGSKSLPADRVRVNVTKNPATRLSDGQISVEIMSVVQRFFDIQHWDFGQTFYATQIIGLIHQRLPGDIASIVFTSSLTGKTLENIEPGMDEILQSCLTASDIVIV